MATIPSLYRAIYWPVFALFGYFTLKTESGESSEEKVG